MHGQILELVDSAKYLGVFFHKKLSWNTHVTTLPKKPIKSDVLFNVTFKELVIKISSSNPIRKDIMSGQSWNIT